jgi:uncharacterized protein YcfL
MGLHSMQRGQRFSSVVAFGAVLAGGLAASLLSGCNTVHGPISAGGDPVSRANYPRVTVDPQLAGWIVVDQPVVAKTDVLKVTVPVRLTSDNSASNVQYRILFFDASGAPARGGDMNWTFLNLPPRDQRFLVANSMDSDAADWRCEIRVAR